MPSDISNAESVTLEVLAISYNFIANSNLLFWLKAKIASYKKILTK